MISNPGHFNKIAEQKLYPIIINKLKQKNKSQLPRFHVPFWLSYILIYKKLKLYKKSLSQIFMVYIRVVTGRTQNFT